jgi:hypothetical protein
MVVAKAILPINSEAIVDLAPRSPTAKKMLVTLDLARAEWYRNVDLFGDRARRAASLPSPLAGIWNGTLARLGV